jgi:hypothetical protein
MNVDVKFLLFIYFPTVYVFLEIRLGFAGDRAAAGIKMGQELASGLVTSHFSRGVV